jgi:hypothetical protein
MWGWIHLLVKAKMRRMKNNTRVENVASVTKKVNNTGCKTLNK